MKLLLWIITFFPLGLYAQMTSDSLDFGTTYEQLKKQSKTLKIAGWVGTGTGVILWGVALAKGSVAVAEEIVYPLVGQEADNNDNGGAEFLIGTVFIAGGITALIVGGNKSKKANRMLLDNKVTFQPRAYPINISPKAKIKQNGFTLTIPIGK